MLDKRSLLRFLHAQAERPLRAKEIARALGVAAEDYGRLKSLLREMEEAGEIYRVRKRRYALPERINLVVGRLQITRAGPGFVIPDDGGEDLFIHASDLGNAFDGDHVVARLDRHRKGRNPQGTIVRVLERARSRVVGAFRRSGRFGLVVPSEKTFHRDVFVAPGGESVAREGDLVVTRITDWGSDHSNPLGEITEVLGPPGKPGVDILAIIHNHELPPDFPARAQAEAAAVAQRSHDADALRGRSDFRDLLTFTIDPVDAKDHDDALSIVRLARDRWRVGVHIADVTHFVDEDGAVDAEARVRGTSVYLVDRVLPMLPEVLSGGVCSLKTGEDRLTVSLTLVMDSKGGVVEAELTPAIIRSRHALSYEEAQEIIDGKRRSDRQLRESLQQLSKIARGLRARRQQRGGLDFDLPEARVIVNAAGEPTRVQRILRLDTHRLVEEFMILANEWVARLGRDRNWPFIYRIHEAPDAEKIESLREFVAGLGLKLAKDAHRSPKALQKLLSSVDDRPEGPLVSMLVLRSMKQARYSTDGKGHFGLGARVYTHFTSPIRRYPDLAVHRVIRKLLFQGERAPDSASEELAAVASRASICERAATEAERESVELKKIEYMERHLGDLFTGTISGVTSFGLFVLLDDVLVEGLVHVSQIEDDYYRFQEEQFALVGELKRRRFQLGDRVKVQVMAVRREERELDLTLVGA